MRPTDQNSTEGWGRGLRKALNFASLWRHPTSLIRSEFSLGVFLEMVCLSHQIGRLSGVKTYVSASCWESAEGRASSPFPHCPLPHLPLSPASPSQGCQQHRQTPVSGVMDRQTEGLMAIRRCCQGSLVPA